MKIDKSLILLLLILTGCSALPSVKYTKIDNIEQFKKAQSDKYIDSFSLRDTRLVFNKTSKKDSAGKDKPDVTLSAEPIEFTGFKIIMDRDDGIGITTTLNLAKIENSSLPSEIGSDVTDKRVETIGKLGGAFVSAMAVLSGDKSENSIPEINLDKLPFQISLQKNHLHNNPRLYENTLDIGARIIVNQIPPDALPISSLDTPLKSNSLIYAACRKAEVSFKVNGIPKKYEFSVNDPDYFQTIAFPEKGKIKMHSECGASAISEKNDSIASNAEIFEAIANQAKAIKEALDKK